MNLKKFDEYTKVVDSEVRKALSGKPKKLYNATRHITFAGGKRIRPLLCILSCKSVGGDTKNAIKTASAIELIHTFTLIHDDIMDQDEFRRGVYSVHRAYGEPTAILAGDLLFSKAFEISDPSVIKILAIATAEICEGQELDMNFEKRDYVTENEYLEMIRKKTAVLFEAATKSGAVIGRGTKAQIKALSDYGLDIGMAFQIHDDILGITADEKKLGKPVGSDIGRRKKSIVVIKGLDFLEGSNRERFIEILNKEKKGKNDIKSAISLLQSSGVINYCRKISDDFIKDAKKKLGKIPDSDAKMDLLNIADFIVERRI